MKSNRSMMVAAVLTVLAGSAAAAPDWQAQRAMAAEQLAADHEYRWQQQARQQEQAQRRKATQAAEDAARREHQQYRWQARSQERQSVSVFASNVPGSSKLSGKGPR